MASNSEVIERVSAEVIRQLEQGVAPWSKPWNVAGLMPTSLATGKPYRGANALFLSMLAPSFDGPNLWTTYKQAGQRGGKVRKGEKGTPVIFWKFLKVEDKKATDENGKPLAKSVPLLRVFTVFHVAQCDGLEIPAKYLQERKPVEIPDAVTSVLSTYENGPAIHYREQDAAYYSPSQDAITLPPVATFPTLEGYAETLFHELTHSTGHRSRLNRFRDDEVPARFGSANYAKEELIAELGAAMIAANVGVNLDVTQTGSYIAGWLSALKNDPGMLISAAQKAQKAADLVLGIKTTAEETEETLEEVAA